MDKEALKELKLKQTQMEDNLFQFGGILERQGSTLAAVNQTLGKIEEAIRGVADISKTQARNSEKLTNLTTQCHRQHTRTDNDIAKLYELIGQTRCGRHEAEIDLIKKSVEKNSKADEAQNARSFNLFQALAVGIFTAICAGVFGFLFSHLNT